MCSNNSLVASMPGPQQPALQHRALLGCMLCTALGCSSCCLCVLQPAFQLTVLLCSCGNLHGELQRVQLGYLLSAHSSRVLLCHTVADHSWLVMWSLQKVVWHAVA